MSDDVKRCDNPCKDFIMYGCGNKNCTSNCHQDEGFYERYNTPELLSQRLADVKKSMDEWTEKCERETYEKLKLKFEKT